MSLDEDTLAALRQAVQISPENFPLRQHLAETLLRQGRFEEAVTEYRAAVRLEPQDAKLRLGLATAYYRQGKTSQASVVVDDLLRMPDTPAGVYLLHARLLETRSEIDAARDAYRSAIGKDPKLTDSDLARRLGAEMHASSERGGEEFTFSDLPDDDTDAFSSTDDEEVVDGRVRQRAGDERGGGAVGDFERPPIRFEQVGGMEHVKEEIRLKIIYPLEHAELYEAYGKKIGGGILMYGPPGCGKTMLAKATAGEIRADFLAVGINEVLDMWLGNSERNLHDLFEQARRRQPCVMFFDEVDALGASRTDMRHSAGRHLINQFLAELDGVKASNDGLLILGATNAPWHLDTAFRRPGRFGQVIFVPPPDAPAARAAILRVICRGKPIDAVDFDALAKRCEGFSGADLVALVDAAVEDKLRDAMRTGRPSPLATRDLLASAKNIRPSTQEWFATARNYAVYSNQGGVYDDILKYLKL